MYLKEEFILVLSTEQQHCFSSMLIMGDVSNMLDNRIYRVYSNTTSNKKQIRAGITRFWIKIKVPSHSHVNLTADTTLQVNTSISTIHVLPAQRILQINCRTKHNHVTTTLHSTISIYYNVQVVFLS